MTALSWDEIQNIMSQRRLQDTLLIRQAQDVRDRFNGDLVIPLADVEGEPELNSPTPNLIADVIETTAMRCASTTPTIHVPALDPLGANSVKRAQTRRRALYATWDSSSLIETILPRSYRHLTGYGTNCMIVLPDYETMRARIEVRDPLTAYPEHRAPEDTREPQNCGFIYGRSPQWIMQHYPASVTHFQGIHQKLQGRNPRTANQMWDCLWDVVEWLDPDQIAMGILGPREELSADSNAATGAFPQGMGLHLRTIPNRAGMVPIASPRRVTLDRIEGQVSKLTGLVDMMGKLMALDVLAAEKAVFADMVVFSKDGTPQLLNASGRWNDGRTGEANLLKADGIQLLQSSPGPLTHPVVDRLEGYYRQSGGLSQLAVGQNTNGLRTGNALDSMTAISIDPRIQEAQRLMTRALKVVNTAVVEVEKGYFPNRKQVFFSGWPGDFGHVTYTLAKDFDSNENAVSYAFPGTDINSLTVTIGQAVGVGLISKKSGRAKHPLISDEENEEKTIIKETIEEAAMATFIQQAQTGQLPLIDLANIYEKYEQTGSWVDAIRAANKEAQERQASSPPEAMAPEAQPGLAMPGQGVEALGQPSIPGANEANLDFRQLVNALSAGAPQQ